MWRRLAIRPTRIEKSNGFSEFASKKTQLKRGMWRLKRNQLDM